MAEGSPPPPGSYQLGQCPHPTPPAVVLLLKPIVSNYRGTKLFPWNHLSSCKKWVSCVRRPLPSTTIHKWRRSTTLAAKVSLITSFFLAKHSWRLTLTFRWSGAGSFYSSGKACIKSKNGHSDRGSNRLNISAGWCPLLVLHPDIFCWKALFNA